jgi:Putative zinc-finger
MTSPVPDALGPAGGAAWHPEADLLASYAAGSAGAVAAWSVEAHLTGCARCRAALSARADPERLARNRSVLLVRAALGDGGLVRRLLRRCGIPDHVLRLLAATSSVRLSWLLSVLGVLAVVAGEAAAVRPGRIPGHAPAGLAGIPDSQILVPFLLTAPLLVLAGVAAAFLPMFDPAYRLTVAAPFSGFTLLLARAVCALAGALVLVVTAAVVLPGPGWLPAALLLPSLAVCGFALAAASVMEARAAVITAGALWVLPVLLLAARHLPLVILHWRAQSACAAVLCLCALVLLKRRDRFELGWTT